MSNLVTDTHGLIWYLEDSPRLGDQANQAFAACERGELLIYVPTICLIEIVYLQEKGRIPANLQTLFEQELSSGTHFVLADLTIGVVNTISQIPRATVPELADRIIAATALYLSNLVTVW